MNIVARSLSLRTQRLEMLCNWLALLALLALGVVLPGG
jgi:hypothetical protein